MLGTVSRTLRMSTPVMSIAAAKPHLATASATPDHSRRKALAGLRENVSHRLSRAHYFYDAAHQTSKGFELLMNDILLAVSEPERKQISQSIVQMAMTLFASVHRHSDNNMSEPGHLQDLARMHLGGLDQRMIAALERVLLDSGFSIKMVESVLDDEMMLEYGFSNGPPSYRTRSVMETEDVYVLLREIGKSKAAPASAAARANQFDRQLFCAKKIRQWITDMADCWSMTSGCRTIAFFDDVVRQLFEIMNLPPAAVALKTGPIGVYGSTVAFGKEIVTIDSGASESLFATRHPNSFATVLKDLVEAAMIIKLFGRQSTELLGTSCLTDGQQALLRRRLDQVYDKTWPESVSPEQREMAARVLEHRAHFGEVKIIPGSGVSLGHSWIAPHLSVIADKLPEKCRTIGVHYIRPGYSRSASATGIKEYPALFLNENQHEGVYGGQSAMSATVPVDRQALDIAAKSTVGELQEKAVPFVFSGANPALPGNTCRTSVWSATGKGMQPEARLLFDRFNCGLPDPVSCTELLIRLRGFMRWLEHIAKPPTSGREVGF